MNAFIKKLKCSFSRFSLVLCLLFASVLSIELLLSQAEAKVLHNRLGIGFKNQMSEDLPSFAVQYYPLPEIGISGSLGIDTQESNSKLGVLFKVYRIIFMEDNLNFYMAAGAGILSRTGSHSQNESGFELGGYLGCEYFFSGLENLGFSFETGVGVTSLPSGVRFRSLGDHPLRAGIIFYF